PMKLGRRTIAITMLALSVALDRSRAGDPDGTRASTSTPASHWAFRKSKPPAPPAEAPHPIDAFLRARLKTANLKPSPEADRPTLIRRLSLDLTGLPPSP